MCLKTKIAYNVEPTGVGCGSEACAPSSCVRTKDQRREAKRTSAKRDTPHAVVDTMNVATGHDVPLCLARFPPM